MQGRVFSSAAYRYGFNGKEKEVDGTADNYDFGARIYDGRLGRWMAVDPHQRRYTEYSTYCYSFNSSLLFNDPDGKDARMSIVHHTPDEVQNTGITHTVILETKVILYGPNAGSIDVAALNKQFEALGTDRYFKEPGSNNITKVTIKLTFCYAPELDSKSGENTELKTAENIVGKDDAFIKKIDFQAGDNLLEVNNSKLKAKEGGIQGGSAPQGGNNGKTSTNPDDIIHEAMHEMGFDERYTIPSQLLDDEATATHSGTHSGFNNDPMHGYTTTSGDALNPPPAYAEVNELHLIHFWDVLMYAIQNKETIGNNGVLVNHKIDNTGRGGSPTEQTKIDNANSFEVPAPKSEKVK